MLGYCHFSSSEHADYRFGFNGMEKDDEVTNGNGNTYTTPFRMLDPRLGGRWWARDPIVKPWESPYAGFGNNPIYYKDPSGLTPTEGGDPTDPPKNPKEGDTWTKKDENGNTWEYSYSEQDGWVGNGGMANTLPEVVIPDRMISGSAPVIEPVETRVKPPVELPTWAKRLKTAAWIGKRIPYVGEVNTLVKIANEPNALSNNKNPSGKVTGKILQKVTNNSKIGSAAATATASMIINDYSEGLEESMFEAHMNFLSQISNYSDFAYQVNMYNDGLSRGDGRTVIMLYTDVEAQVEEIFYSANGLNPTWLARLKESLERGHEYDGWKPKFVIWGTKDDFTGDMMMIRGVVEINYDQ